jgi:hypothetical protein
VYLPVSGLSLGESELALGSVRLRFASNELVGEILAAMDQIVQTTRHTPEEKQELLRSHAEDLTRDIAGHVVSIYTVVAEPRRARERAEEETRRALDLLRLAIPLLYDRDKRVQVGFPGEIVWAYRRSISLSDKAYQSNAKLAGNTQPFELTADRLAYLRSLGVLDLSAVLAKPRGDLTDFEQALLRGVHWFASAQSQVEPENGFVDLVTCIEAFLTPRDGTPIGTAIAEGTALLLGEDADARKQIKRRVQHLYGKRCGVSHGGSRAILDADYAALEEIAGGLTLALIRRRDEFRSRTDLLDWIEDRKLS